MNRDEMASVFADAYVYGYPTVDCHKLLGEQALVPASAEFKASLNQVGHARGVATPDDRSVVAPNVDTPYSYLWLDLRAEPVVVTIPAFDEGRYVAIELFDLYTYIAGYVSPRTNGNRGGDFLISGPSWSGAVPDAVSGVFDVPTDLGFALFRTPLLGPHDLSRVHAIQDGLCARPLSSYLGTAAPAAAALRTNVPPLDVRRDVEDPRFFAVLGEMLQYMPVLPEERELRGRFAEVGIVPGAVFPPADDVLEPAVAGMRQGLSRVLERARAVRSSAEIFGSREQLGTDYLSRAAGALLGIFGNSAEEYLGVGWQADSQGAPFNGAHRYEVRFEGDAMPPVDAFWSITVYTADKYLYANEIDRYVVNSPMLTSLQRGPDGSFSIYIQHDNPGPARVANWLPAPEGDFGLTMRCYQPRAPIRNGSWLAPPVVPVGAPAADSEPTSVT